MINHTPEAWRVGRPGTVVCDTPVPGMGGSDAVEYYGGHLIAESITEVNARRIVACVNACAGIETDRLEQIPKLKQDPLPIWTAYCEKKMQLEDVTEQRDELLEALELVESVYRLNVVATGEPSSTLCAIQRAIAKTKGGAA